MNKSITTMFALMISTYTISAQSVLVFDDFESEDFASKGWYDGFSDHRTMNEFKNGNYSYEGFFAKGSTKSGAGRHLFTETDKVYISYWVKYSSNWVGSGVAYHPHEWNILTNQDGIYQGPADTYLTVYIEQNAGKPLLALQDSKNVDPNCILLNNDSFVDCNGNFSTYRFTENRSVCSCNGLKGYLDRRDCFVSSENTHGYYSARIWDADMVYFSNEKGPYYKNNWHFIEAYFELNRIESGVGVPNGKIRYWYDGQLLITSDSILFRTAAHPNMKFNQLFYGPYIGVGSPIDQTWWVDDLTVMDGMPVPGVNRQNKINNAISFFPNPSGGKFTLKSNGNINLIEIYNMFGAKVFANNLKQQISNEIDFSESAKGIYFVKIYDSEEIYNRKIVIE